MVALTRLASLGDGKNNADTVYRSNRSKCEVNRYAVAVIQRVPIAFQSCKKAARYVVWQV